MTTIYRVQDCDGRGPWRPGFALQWVHDRPDLSNLQPWFIDMGRVDLDAGAGMHLGTGCRSLEHLRRWFLRAEYAWLLAHGYAAVSLRVGRILGESATQCVFERSRPLNQRTTRVDLYGPGVR